jgi:hypothetical protein
VFLSCAHEHPEHEATVLELWLFLRANGVDAKLDVPAAQQPSDWAVRMLREVREADVVLVVASEADKRQRGGRRRLT